MKKSPLKKEQIMMYDLGEMAIVEYVVPTFQGLETNQMNLFAYLTRGVHWSYIHLSKMKFVPGEQGLFRQILGSVKFNDSYSPTALDLFEFGNLSFYRKDFPGAISYYRRALELDKNRKNLGREAWLTLVDHLGMAYMLSGDFTKARQNYEWGISQESEYPMFFYNLACACAEMNQMDEALSNLRLAFKCKGKLLPDQEFPNPRSDSSFKKYINNKVFMAELQKLE
jgi:tetratricopeptide (TPR) repeat protein